MEKVTMSSDGQGSWSNYDAEGKLVEIGVSDVDTIYRQIVYMAKKKIWILRNFWLSELRIRRWLWNYIRKGCCEGRK